MNALSRGIPFLLCAGWLATAPVTALAQPASNYPGKPVRVIIPFGVGSGADAVMAIYGERFNKELGYPFILEHRAGGDSIIGVTVGVKATPDGYTFFTATSTLLINHWLYPDLQYDTLKDITMISALTRSNSVLAVHPSVPANNLKEFIAFARANPGKLNVGSTASGAVLHYQRFMNLTGTKLVLVNYKGASQALTDLVAGYVQGIMNNAPNLAPWIKAGKVKALAIGGDKRTSTLPDVPTFAEAGLRDFNPNNWIALFASSKTPGEIVEKMNLQVRKAQATPEVITALDRLGLTPYGPMSVPQANDLLRAELDRFGKLIKDAGLKAGNI
jgi:tripartite-type tricarboxylate transporter receptor subunit TctC